MDDEILDDDMLLKNRLMLALHRNEDGHLCSNPRRHADAISDDHNALTLYYYTYDADGFYTAHEYLIYNADQPTYKQWHRLAIATAIELEAAVENWHGAYGWTTVKIKFTPLRDGDAFIKIDDTGVTGVRLTFDRRTNNGKTHREKTKKRQ